MSKGENAHLRPHLFKKGTSGNPSGRSKTHAVFQNLARSYSVEALETVVEIMRNKKHPRLALKAAEILIERAWGRVPNVLTGEGGEGPVKLEVSWKSADVATIDVTPVEVPLIESAEEDE